MNDLKFKSFFPNYLPVLNSTLIVAFCPRINGQLSSVCEQPSTETIPKLASGVEPEVQSVITSAFAVIFINTKQ